MNNDGVLCYYILQKAFPHWVGLLVANSPVEGALANAPIAGYNLWVTFSGTLRGRIIPDYRNIQSEINSAFADMAEWYLANRIRQNEKIYRKFKIISNVD
jgi:hypothetical protein